jgi:acetyl-CoA C-acetyltransferase
VKELKSNYGNLWLRGLIYYKELENFMTTSKVYIVDCARTAIGSFMGTLKSLPAQKLGEIVLRALIARNNLNPELISEVILGQVLNAGYGQNPARQASINAGIPKEKPAFIVNLVCGSGLKSVCLAAQAIALGESSIVLAGGQESMSMSKHTGYLRSGARMGDVSLNDSMITDGLTDAFHDYHMGITAENVATKYNITRKEQDEFACLSQNKAEKAQTSGEFDAEIIPVEIKNKKEDIIFSKDEFVRPGTTIEKLENLKPSFKENGTVTAGNASGVNDGAAAILLVGEEMLKKLDLKPMAKIISYNVSGVDPEIMGTGPISAVEGALKKANWSKNDLDLIEANEAFAAQAIAVNKELKWDISKVNVNGGAIALGHPIGASGARILTTLIHAMKKRKARKGLATLCIGGGCVVYLTCL